MLMITGFPGFVNKIYCVDPEDGYWQGICQWASKEDLNKYKGSFVFKMMKKRAEKGTLKIFEIEDLSIDGLLEYNGKSQGDK